MPCPFYNTDNTNNNNSLNIKNIKHNKKKKISISKILIKNLIINF